jgi:hypothetical protein
LLWGLTGAIGVYAQDRTALIGGRAAVAGDIQVAEHELAEVDANLKPITVDRTVAQIDAAIAAVLARPLMSGERIRGSVGKLSNNCTKDERSTADRALMRRSHDRFWI